MDGKMKSVIVLVSHCFRRTNNINVSFSVILRISVIVHLETLGTSAPKFVLISSCCYSFISAQCPNY